MSYLLIAASVLTGLTILFWVMSDNDWNTNFFLLTLSIISGFASLCLWIIIGFSIFHWTASEYKANIINKEYKTNYTREEIFFGNDVIEEIQQIKRQRIEVNGNLLKDKK